MVAALATLLALPLAAVIGAVRRVPAGQVHSLYRRGRPLRLLQPGLHLVCPGLDRIKHRIDLAGHVLRFRESLGEAEAVQGTVYWQVLEPALADEVIEQIDQLIRHRTLDALRAETGLGQADRRALGGRLKTALNAVLRQRGMMVTRVELDLA